jgi:trans-aconitate 2-methyltransferase
MDCWNPELYSVSSSPQKSWGIELITKLNLKGNEKVLDVGCGDGKLSAEMARKLPEGSVLGIDLSQSMITFAREHYLPENFPNLAFMQIDATDLNFSSEFDIVFSNAAIHWIKDHELVLKVIWKSLKPGGKFLAQFGGRGNAAEIFEVVDLMLEDEKWISYFKNFIFPFRFYGPAEYLKWLKSTGFSVKRLELNPKDMFLEGKRELFAWSFSILHPYTRQVPQNMQETFINEFVSIFVNNHPPDNKGYVHVRMIRLEIEAYAEK